jgi:lysine decarboxylase
MTQSSILNIKEGLISPKRVQSIISMLTTTSTSYLLLASLDTARRRLATEGRELAQNAINLAQRTRNRINEIKHLYCFGEEIIDKKATFDYDPTKLTISVNDLGITGYEAEVWLREEHNIEVEMSDLYNILCIITPGDTEKETTILLNALEELSSSFEHKSKKETVSVHIPDIPVLALSPRDAFYADTEVVPFDESAGRIIAEFIMVYPPGIPIFIPGEIITEENLNYIRKNQEVGLPVQGPEDYDLRHLRVIKEHRAIR